MNHLKYLSNTSFRKLKLKNCQRTHKIHIQSKLDGTEKLLVTEVEYKHFIRLHPINQPLAMFGEGGPVFALVVCFLTVRFRQLVVAAQFIQQNETSVYLLLVRPSRPHTH